MVGDACPYCGGGKLVRVIAPTAVSSLRHPAVLSLVLTFTVGLVVLRILLIAIHSPVLYTSPDMREVLWQLQFTTGTSAALYLILRRSEGDFRALLIVALGLFVATESTGALARDYGVYGLSLLCKIFNVTLFMFSGMAMTAAVADGRRADRYHACLVAAGMGFLFLSAVRTFFNIRSRDIDERSSSVSTMVLTGVIIYVLVLLVRGELRGRRSAAPAAAKPVETPGISIAKSDVPAETAQAVESQQHKQES